MLTTTPHPHIHIVSFPLLHRPKAPNSSFIEHVEDNANHFTSPPSATVSADRFGLYNQPDWQTILTSLLRTPSSSSASKALSRISSVE
ncbi:hypothetical protein CMV_019986, partial [Castanea mollissima]